MSVISLDRRLRKLESIRGFRGDITQASDAQLEALIRASYRELEAEHGSLAKAAEQLSRTGDQGDAALAMLLREEIEAGRS